MHDRLDNAACGLLTIDLQGHIISINNTFSNLVGFTKEELENNHIELLLNNANKLFFHTILYPKIRTSGSIQEMYLTLRKKDHSIINIIFNANMFEVDSQFLIDCIVIPIQNRIEYEKEIREINKKLTQTLEEKTMLHDKLQQHQAKLVELNEQLQLLASRDPLTNLYNRRVFVEQLDLYVQSFYNNHVPFSLCIIDIDHFKQVNDNWGHNVGDDMIKNLADTMVSMFSNKFTVARFGGEEFVILMPEIESYQAISYAEQLRNKVKKATWNTIELTISLGIATFSHVDNTDSIIAKADYALYESKRNGRDQETHADSLNRTFSSESHYYKRRGST
ncbi:sensor domain-containing diguanylate cyclase [Gracilibacillus massiliensis]|uniref:sensor domain-containing diguanylate cyclase n=1 Tax=Gracilibacillus massiliensis TaxID=1564956 RepID=UPI00071D1F26|nr:sensor domain-containing diguanylate cyclase [Gracilibacillus massiliensis]